MTTSLSKIIDLLPELTEGELSQLSAVLMVRGAAAPYHSNRGLGKSKNKAGKPSSKPGAKKKKEKGKSAPKVSEYKDIPEYKEFKASEKAMNIYLKGKEGDERLLSYWVNKQSDILLLSEAEKVNLLASIPPVIAGFIEARNWWFRAKGNLSSEKPAPRPKPTYEDDSEEGDEVAEEGSLDATTAVL